MFVSILAFCRAESGRLAETSHEGSRLKWDNGGTDTLSKSFSA